MLCLKISLPIRPIKSDVERNNATKKPGYMTTLIIKEGTILQLLHTTRPYSVARLDHIKPHSPSIPTKTPIMNSTYILTVSLVILFASLNDAFQPNSICSKKLATHSSSIRNFATILNAKVGGDEEDSFPSGDSYKGSVDWDAEWAKVVKEKGPDIERPGKDYYKNDAQRAALKAQKVTGEQIKKVKIVKPDVDFKSLSADPKFWIAICK